MIITAINIFLLVLLVIAGIAIHFQRNLFAAVMMLGVFSFICAVLFISMDAVDVAFTEAAVGAGISTLLFLSALVHTGYYEKPVLNFQGLAFLIVLCVGGLLIYGFSDLPEFGSLAQPVHSYLSPRFLIESIKEIDVPNIVTAVLASYRGFDTLGEVCVIFTAGISVMMILDNKSEKEAS